MGVHHIWKGMPAARGPARRFRAAEDLCQDLAPGFQGQRGPA